MAKRAAERSEKTGSDSSAAAALERYFGLKEQGTDVRTEFIAGLTTFLTMVYIVFVNPSILGKTGMDTGAVLRIRQYVIDSIPHNLKLAVSAGVGLFLGIIALEEAKIVVAHPATLVTLGDLRHWEPVLMLFGFVLIAALNYRRIMGGTLIGILVVALIGIPLGLTHYNGIVSLPPSTDPTLLKLDFSRVLKGTFLFVIFSILFIDVFDNP